MGIWLRGKSWYYDFQVKGKRYVGRIGPVSKTIAKEVAARKKSEAYQGLLGIKTAIKDPLFEPFALEFLEYYRQTHRPSSTRSCQSHIKHFILAFGKQRLSEISPKDIEQFKANQLADGRAPASVNRYLVILSQMFARAMSMAQATTNPVAEVELLRVRNARTRFLSEEEEAMLLKECAPPLRSVVLFAIHTGMRRSEITRLEWRDIDLQRLVVRVRAEHAKSGGSQGDPARSDHASTPTEDWT